MNKYSDIHNLSSLTYAMIAAALLFWAATSVGHLVESMVNR